MSNFNTLTVYLGSSGNARPVFLDAALRLGTMIGRSRRRLVYGGMDAGLMGLIATHALKAGGQVTGIVPQKLKDSERILQNLSETILVGDLWERKRRMFDMADAVIALPGGFGTLDESLEILYWAHLGLHNKPLVLVNVENYWTSIIEFLRKQKDFNPKFLIVADAPEDIIPRLENWNAPAAPLKPPEKFPHFEAEISRATDKPIILAKPSVETAYYGVCALGLKQLGKHKRAIGFLNKSGQFDELLDWIQQAAEEKFITPKCLQLFSVAEDEKRLDELLGSQLPVAIDLHADKWGARTK